MKYTLLIILALFIFEKGNSQTIEATYYGSWAETIWQFDFFKNGTFIRTIKGHYSNDKVLGNYTIQSDTIRTTIRNKISDRIENSFYLLDGDSCIIDLKLKYDYCKNQKIKNKEDGNGLYWYPKSRYREEIIFRPDSTK